MWTSGKRVLDDALLANWQNSFLGWYLRLVTYIIAPFNTALSMLVNGLYS